MTDKKSIKLMFFLGIMALSLALLPSHSWARDSDGDGFNSKVDCNDNDSSIYPGATEICDSKDNNCDGQIDEGGVCGPVCHDIDKDGFYAENGCGSVVDCNDANADVYPGAPELCGDTIDNQCPGDSGYGYTNETCSACTDTDEDGYFASSGCGTAVDCDDSSSAIKPEGTDYCGIYGTGDGIDNNCNGQTDEDCEVTVSDDTDGDGLPDAAETDLAGLEISHEFQVWDGSSFVTPTGNRIHGLDPNIPDVFVIWRPLATGSKVNLASCNIFEFVDTQAGFGLWILKETSPTLDRQIAEDSAVSLQKAAVLLELSSTSGDSTGLSLPGTIMIDGKGAAWIKTYTIEGNINDPANCGSGPDCFVEGIGYIPKADAMCHHFKKTASHEIWHVLSALKTADLHIATNVFIMSPAVIYTGGTAYIGDEFSSAGLIDPEFQ